MANSDEVEVEEVAPGSLVARAKASPAGKFRGKPVTDELTDLAIAFVRGEVTSTQAATVLGGARQSAVQRLWTAFRVAVRAGRVEVADTWTAARAGAVPEVPWEERRLGTPAVNGRGR